MHHEEYMELRARYWELHRKLRARGVKDIPALVPCNASQQDMRDWDLQMRVRFRFAGYPTKPTEQCASQLIVVVH